MDDDLDYQLSYDMFPGSNFNGQKQILQDLMLQPITTQQKFNPKQKFNKKSPKDHVSQSESRKQILLSNLDSKNNLIRQQNELKNKQAMKFNQYLNQKATQLRNQKQRTKIGQKQMQSSKTKANPLRKIINNQQNRQRQNGKAKNKLTGDKNNTSANQNAKQTNKAIQPGTSLSGYKGDIKKVQHEKRFSNSHSNLVKNDERVKSTISQNNHLSQVKKSLDLGANSKTPKLPSLTPLVKPPFPSKKQIKQIKQTKQINKMSINNIDQISTKRIRQKQRTPESKNSFRIKRTSNAQQNISRPNDNNNLHEDRQKRPIQKQSPIHLAKNKNLKQQFIRLNQQQIVLQRDILKYHQNYKDHIEQTMKKYNLSSEAFQKFDVKRSTEQQNLNNLSKLGKSLGNKSIKYSKIQAQIERAQSPLKMLQNQNSDIEVQVQKINNLIKSKQRQFKKLESKLQKNSYLQFLKQMPEDILQEDQEDQLEEVAQLPQKTELQQKLSNSQFSSTYSSVMGQMRSKKYGLKQRINFQINREISLGKKQNPRVSEVKAMRLDQNQQNQASNNNLDNIIEVNSRLKNLLFD